jgi:hypothetical protein
MFLSAKEKAAIKVRSASSALVMSTRHNLLTLPRRPREATRRSLLARNAAVPPRLKILTTTMRKRRLPSLLRRRLVARRLLTLTTKTKLPQRKPEAARRRPLLSTTTPRRKRRPKLLRRRLEAVLASHSRPPKKTTRKPNPPRRRLEAVLASRFRLTMLKSRKKRMQSRLKLKLPSRLRTRLEAVLASRCPPPMPMPKKLSQLPQPPLPPKRAEVVPRRSPRRSLPPTALRRRPRRAEAVLANRSERSSNRHPLFRHASSLGSFDSRYASPGASIVLTSITTYPYRSQNHARRASEENCCGATKSEAESAIPAPYFSHTHRSRTNGVEGLQSPIGHAVQGTQKCQHK